MSDQKKWFSMASDGANAEIRIYDQIGAWGVSASAFIDSLKGLGDHVENIVLRINSPGGDVFDGIAIYNELKQHKASITAKIDGWAASMASVIAMAADTIEMPGNTWMMIHNAWTGAVGNAKELKRMVELLEGIDANAARAYHEHASTLSEDDIRALMADETWMNAQDAVGMGFATAITEAIPVEASVDATAFSAVPEEAKVWAKTGDDDDARDDDDDDDEEDDAGDSDPSAAATLAYDEGLAAGEAKARAEIQTELRYTIAVLEKERDEIASENSILKARMVKLLPGMRANEAQPDNEAAPAGPYKTFKEARRDLGFAEAKTKYPELYKAAVSGS